MNIYGLDYEYFKKNLDIIVRDIELYKPMELSRALAKLAELAEDNESEAATDRLDEKQALMQKVADYGGVVD